MFVLFENQNDITQCRRRIHLGGQGSVRPRHRNYFMYL
jgi:hypothetical protein